MLPLWRNVGGLDSSPRCPSHCHIKRLPHREQTSRSRHSGTAVSAPYRRASSATPRRGKPSPSVNGRGRLRRRRAGGAIRPRGNGLIGPINAGSGLQRRGWGARNGSRLGVGSGGWLRRASGPRRAARGECMLRDKVNFSVSWLRQPPLRGKAEIRAQKK